MANKVMILLKKPVFGHTAIVGDGETSGPQGIKLVNVELWCSIITDEDEVLDGDEYYWEAFGHKDSTITAIEIPLTQIRMLIHDEATIERLRKYEV